MTGSASIITAILAVFSEIGAWIVEQLGSLQVIFWGAEGLTFMGVLGVASLAFAVTFLLIGLLQRFLHFRG